MTTPSIPGVDRDALADAIRRARGGWVDRAEGGDPMSTPSIPGVDRDALADAIRKACPAWAWTRLIGDAADAALAYIAAHHECACDREHDDEWVEVDDATWDGLPKGARRRREWVVGVFDGGRRFVHRDDLPDDPRALIARELGPARADTFLGLLDEHGWTVTRKGER